MARRLPVAFLLLLCPALLLSCVASRSPMEGLYAGAAAPTAGAEPRTVLFVFRHEEQMHGYDAIPKLRGHAVKDFDNLLADALRELRNLARYETFTEKPDDVNDSERRAQLAERRAAADYVVEIDLFEDSSFRQQCFSGTVTLLTLSLVPMPYDWNYTFRARVLGKGRGQIAALQRKATLTSWVELFLIFAYPFHPLEGKRESIYAEALHDLFRQIEAERLLR